MGNAPCMTRHKMQTRSLRSAAGNTSAGPELSHLEVHQVELQELLRRGAMLPRIRVETSASIVIDPPTGLSVPNPNPEPLILLDGSVAQTWFGLLVVVDNFLAQRREVCPVQPLWCEPTRSLRCQAVVAIDVAYHALVGGYLERDVSPPAHD